MKVDLVYQNYSQRIDDGTTFVYQKRQIKLLSCITHTILLGMFQKKVLELFVFISKGGYLQGKVFE